MAEEKKPKIEEAEEKESKSKVAAAKPAKPVNKKPPLMKRFKGFLRDYKSELKKIVWPGREQVIKNTGIVVTVIIIVAIIVGLLDLGFVSGMQALGNLVW